MTAPAKITRVTPTGRRLEDGFRTLIAFAIDPDILLWEISVQPPGIDAGEFINITTQHQTRWRQFASRSLITLTDGSFVAAYDPAVTPLIVAIAGIEGAVTILYPNLAALSFYGALRVWDADSMEEGTMPQGTGTVGCTNTDPITGAEEGPVYSAPPAGMPELPSLEEMEQMSEEERIEMFEQRRLMARNMAITAPYRLKKGAAQRARQEGESQFPQSIPVRSKGGVLLGKMPDLVELQADNIEAPQQARRTTSASDPNAGTAHRGFAPGTRHGEGPRPQPPQSPQQKPPEEGK